MALRGLCGVGGAGLLSGRPGDGQVACVMTYPELLRLSRRARSWYLTRCLELSLGWFCAAA
eukprot:6622959-Alexandrium_andersonii.AAC.1